MNFPGFSSAEREPKKEMPVLGDMGEAANEEKFDFNADFLEEIAERLGEVRHILVDGRYSEDEKLDLIKNYRVLKPFLDELEKLDLDDELGKNMERGKRLKALKIDLEAELPEISKIIQ